MIKVGNKYKVVHNTSTFAIGAIVVPIAHTSSKLPLCVISNDYSQLKLAREYCPGSIGYVPSESIREV